MANKTATKRTCTCIDNDSISCPANCKTCKYSNKFNEKTKEKNRGT